MEAKSFYRVAHQSTGQGLWYDPAGNFTGLIRDQFTFCKNTALEMPFDADIVGWLSATSSLDELFAWFTKEDIITLQTYGWAIFEYISTNYKRHHNHWVINPNHSDIENSFIIKPTFKGGDNHKWRISEWDYSATPMHPRDYIALTKNKEKANEDRDEKRFTQL